MSIKTMQLFNRRVYLLAGGLVVACLTLTVLTWLQGARVRSATIDSAKVTAQSNQRILLQFNQTPGAISTQQITITPSVRFVATGGGKTVAIQFGQQLRNNTRYRISIKTAGGRTVHYSFTTGAATFYYVTNTASGSKVHLKEIGSNGDRTVLTGDTISDYLVLGNTLVYTVKDVAGRGTVWLYNAVTRDKKKLALPEDGSAGSLHANLDGKSFGFLFTASDYRSDNTNTLFTYDLGTSKLTQVVGFDTKPLKALEWQFARNGKTIAALGIDSTLLLVNPGSPPLPLGQYDDVRGFTYDDSSIFVDDIRTGKQAINLRTGERTPLPKLPESSYVLTADPLNIEPGSVLRVQSYKGNESSGQIIVNRPQGKKQIYDAGSDEGYIAFNTLSPNDQYVAIELRSGSTDQTTIKIIDTFTGKVVNTVSGAKARWLNGVQ